MNNKSIKCYKNYFNILRGLGFLKVFWYLDLILFVIIWKISYNISWYIYEEKVEDDKRKERRMKEDDGRGATDVKKNEGTND